MGKVLKIKDASIWVIFLAAFLSSLVSLVNQLAGQSFTLNNLATTLLLGGLFVLMEVGIIGLIKSRDFQKDPLGWLAAAVGANAIVLGGLIYGGVGIAAWYSLLSSSLLTIFAVIEALRD